MQDITNIPTRLTTDEITEQFKHINSNWELSVDKKKLVRVFKFKGFMKTMSFVNAAAWIAQSTMHHPDMSVSYNQCIIHYTTHDAGGITQNDFDCALQIDALNA